MKRYRLLYSSQSLFIKVWANIKILDKSGKDFNPKVLPKQTTSMLLIRHDQFVNELLNIEEIV